MADPYPFSEEEKPGGGPGIRLQREAGSRNLILPEVHDSDKILIRIAPGDAGLFRYLLEGGGHLAMLTVLEPKETLLKLVFSPHQKSELFAFLESLRKTVDFQLLEWPFGGGFSSFASNAAAPFAGMERYQ